MKTIVCYCGKEILLDDDVYDRLRFIEFSCLGGSKTIRAIGIGNRQNIAKFIITVPKGLIPDHEDRNYHNNQQSNLRIATRQQNIWNQSSREGTSKYKGVYYNVKTRKWIAQIRFNYRKRHIGSFVSELDAAKAYNKHAKILNKEFAVLNPV